MQSRQQKSGIRSERKPGHIYSLLILLALSACGSSSEVMQLDKDTYMVNASSRWRTNDGVTASGILQADAYCKTQGKRMRMTGGDTSEGVIGLLPPKTTIMFKCETR